MDQQEPSQPVSQTNGVAAAPKRSPKQMGTLFFKGMAMGAADVVPGVSGGTIAFITGIYEELIASLASFNTAALSNLFNGRWKRLWQQVNGTFLLIVFGGIITSIASLARLIGWVLEHHPILLWAYFFGLILVSVIYIARQINFLQIANVITLVGGALIAYQITQLGTVQVSPGYGFVLLSGAIAICAMVLPGISGSFILVLLGMYAHIIDAVRDGDFVTLSFFVTGCALGLISFTHLLSWLLRRFHQLTLALLTGFMAGSLNKIWPWKQQLLENQRLYESNLLPQQFQSLTGQDPQLAGALLATLLGVVTLVLLNRLGNTRPAVSS